MSAAPLAQTLRWRGGAVALSPWLGEVGQAAFYRQIAQADERFTDEIEPLYASLDEPVHLIWETRTRGSRSTGRIASRRRWRTPP